jgi:hypothetical protein
MGPSPNFQNGQIVYFMGRRANWREVIGMGSYLESPFPHYWVQRDGETTLVSKLRLSANPLDDILDRHKSRRDKKRASDATTPVSAADQSEVTQ